MGTYLTGGCLSRRTGVFFTVYLPKIGDPTVHETWMILRKYLHDM